jgi:hypothetical protein
MTIRLLLLAASFLLLGRPALADTAILKGLGKSYNVVIEPLDPEAKKAGLNEASLAKVIQSRLAKRKFSSVAMPGGPEIYGRIVVLTSNDVKGEVLGYGAHVELSCREKAFLARDKTTTFTAPVWFKGNVTVSNPKQFASNVVTVLASLTDQFLNDVQSVNPK